MAQSDIIKVKAHLFSSATKKLLITLLLFSIALEYGLKSYGLQLSNLGSILISVYAIIVISCSVAYGLSLKNQRHLKYLSGLFYLSISLFVLCTAILLLHGNLALSGFNKLAYSVIFFMLFLILFFLIDLLIYIKEKKLKLLLFTLIVIEAIVIFLLNLYILDDEAILSYYAILHFLNGINPYTSAITNILYNKAVTGLGVVLTSNNTIASTFDYPALYFLVGMPFYLITQSSSTTINPNFQQLQFIADTIILIVTYALLYKEKRDLKPKYFAYALLSIMMLSISSPIIFLMLALILILYSDLGNRYSWLFLGLAASLQQQLWPIVLLFIAYSFNTYGKRKAISDIIRMSCVFLVINGYFIISAPKAYFSSVFLPLSLPLPSAKGLLGYIIASNYSIPLNLFTPLFLISIMVSILISLYVNNKKLIPLFSLIPFMLLNHALLIYYLFPIVVFAFTYDLKTKEQDGKFNKIISINKNSRTASILFAILLFLIACLAIYFGHQSYQKNFNISIMNASISTKPNGNLSYQAIIDYNTTYKNFSYLMFIVDYRGTESYYGPYNASLIKNTPYCPYPCINRNALSLYGKGEYQLNATIPANASGTAHVSAIIYNKDYYYLSPQESSS